MAMRGLAAFGCAVLLWPAPASANAAAGPPAASQAKVEAALANVISMIRPGEDGLATIWDGNKYVQCRAEPDHSLRCEAAGTLMQPTLSRVLTPAKADELGKLGWRLDPRFGNYVKTFPPRIPASQVAGAVIQALAVGYDADLPNLETQTDWIASEPCPPRNGPSQNLAGMINDDRAMAGVAIHVCAYTPPPGSAAQPTVSSATDLVSRYGPRVIGELQRLRVNANRRVFFTLNVDAGYVQCQLDTAPSGVYCEAESADSWPVLAAVLTPDRLARLHAAGFIDPGRAPNYSKTYPTGQFDDAAIASELLTILHDVYGYTGRTPITITTEKGPA